MKFRLACIALLIVVTSCTVQKRVHLRGWHVNWNKQNLGKSSREKEKEIVGFNVEDQSYTKRITEEPLIQVNDELVPYCEDVVELNDTLEKVILEPSIHKLSDQFEEREIRHEKLESSKLKKKTRGIRKPLFWITLFISFGVVAIALGIYLFFIAANSTAIWVIVSAIAGGVILAGGGLLFILAIFFVIYVM